MRSARRRIRRLVLCVTAPVWAPLLLIACATEVIFLPREWRLRRDMRRSGRWRSAGRFGNAGLVGGTVIIEWPTFDYSYKRVWWTPDDVATVAPMAPRPDGDDGFDAGDRYHWHPYDQWLAGSYLRSRKGRAVLIRIWDRRSQVAIHRQFQCLQVVSCFSGGEESAAFSRGPIACARLAANRRAHERRRRARGLAFARGWKRTRPAG